jgi:hypothetical protein
MSTTAERLRILRPGETFVFYRGRFDEDIKRCAPHSGEQPHFVAGRKFGPGAPTYEKLLRDLWLTATSLDQAGLIKLVERELELPPRDNPRGGASWQPRKTTEYSAIGVGVAANPAQVREMAL